MAASTSTSWLAKPMSLHQNASSSATAAHRVNPRTARNDCQQHHRRTRAGINADVRLLADAAGGVDFGTVGAMAFVGLLHQLRVATVCVRAQ